MFRNFSCAFLFLLLASFTAADNRPELVLQAGHISAIRAVAISPDARWLVSGGQDTTVKIWDLTTGNLLRTLYGHNGKINMVAVSLNGRWIASCADDGTARIWDVMGGSEVRDISGHYGAIDSVAFNASGQVVTATPDVVKIWDPNTGGEIRSIRISEKDKGGRITLSADGRIFVIGGAVGKPGGGFMGYGGGDVFRPLKVMDIASGKELISIKTDAQSPYAMFALSPDSRLLAIRKTDYEDNQNQESIRILDVASDREVRTIRIPGSGSSHATGALTFSPGGKWIVAQSEMQDDLQAKLYVFDVVSGQQMHALTTSGMFMPGVNMDVASTVINPMAFSSDGKVIAFGGTSSIQLWDATTGKEMRALRTHLKAGATTTSVVTPQSAETAKQVEQYGMTQEDMSTMQGDVSGMMESLQGEESALSDVFRFANAISGKTGVMVTRTYADKRLQFTPDGRWLFHEKEKRVGIWDVSTGNYFQNSINMTAPIAFSADQRFVASMEYDLSNIQQQQKVPEAELVVRALPSMKVLHKNKFTDQGVEELAFAQDGSWLAVKIRSASGNDIRFLDTNTGKELRSIPLGDSSGTTTAVFSANGKYLAYGSNPIAAGSASPDVFTMGTPNMQMPQKMDKKQLEKMQKDMEKQMKALSEMMKGGTGAIQQQPYEIKIIDLQSGQPLRTFGVEPPPRTEGEIVPFGMSQMAGEEHRLVFSKDGSMLAVEDTNYEIPTLKVYEVSSGRLVMLFQVSDKPIARTNASDPSGMFRTRMSRPNFAFSTDNAILAVTSQEGGYAVKLYQLSSGQLTRSLPHNNRVEAISFSPDRRFLVSLIRDGSQCIWDLKSGNLLATLMEFPGLNFGTEWLVATPDGLFDGSPAAWNQILWRFSQNTFDLAPVETFFNDLYYPGLLAEIFSSNPPAAPRDISRIDRRLPTVLLSSTSDGSSRDAAVKIQITEASSDASHPSGSGAKDVRLFRNGSLVKVWRGDVLKGQNSITLEATVPIMADENRFVAYAFNHENVKSQDSFIRIQGAESLRRQGIAYVIAIGVNQYANPDFNLKYAVADAQAFTENLSKTQSALGKYSKVEVISLFDQEATKANILAAVQKIEATQPEDAVFLYYAGHGTAEQSRFYMIPHDLGYTGPRSELNDASMKTIVSNSISDEELETYLEKIGAGQVLLVIDACNSGQALETEERRRGPMNAKGLAQLAYEKGMYVLAAAQGYQAALEAAKLGHGYLTYALVEEGIKTKSADKLPADGEVMVREWLDYAANRVPEMQLEKMSEGRLLKHEVAFVDGEEKMEDLRRRSVQQPRVFYRRDSDLQQMIILKQ